MDLKIFFDYLDWIWSIFRGQKSCNISQLLETGNVIVTIEREGYSLRFLNGDLADGNRRQKMSIEEVFLGIEADRPIILILAQDRYLMRDLSEKKLPYSRAHTMALIDMEETFPFLFSDSYVLIPRNEITHGTRYMVVRKVIIDSALAAVTEVSRIVSAIGFETEGGIEYASRPNFRSLYIGKKGNNFIINLKYILFVSIAILSIVTFAHVYIKNSVAVAHLTELVEAEEKRGLLVKKKQEANQRVFALTRAARENKAETVPLVILWEELTRVLPDNTWITDLTVKDNRIVISGFSMSAANLIAILSTSPLFKNPSFTSAVVHVPGQEGERFGIQIELVKQ